MTILELVADARHRLARAPFRPAAREAHLLLGEVLGWTEAQILARSDRAVSPAVRARFQELLDRRVKGEPVAYLLGRREFFGRSFVVDNRVLIPRPESEHLIETALELDLAPDARILDLGTGSGCLAVTLACELPSARVVALDLSPAALCVAQRNCRQHGVSNRVHLLAGDLAAPLDLADFHLVVSNPPYVDPSAAADLSPEITRYEPAEALFAPGSADSVLRRLVSELAGVPRGAFLILEIGQGQVDRMSGLLSEAAFALIEIRADLSGIPRTVLARRR